MKNQQTAIDRIAFGSKCSLGNQASLSCKECEQLVFFNADDSLMCYNGNL